MATKSTIVTRCTTVLSEFVVRGLSSMIHKVKMQENMQIENVSANQRPVWPSCFPVWPEKHKLGRGHLRSCILSCFVEFRSAVSERKSKMSQPIRSQGGHLVFPINTNLVEDIEILLPVKFR